MYIASCKVNWIPESEKVWLRNLESWALKSGIPLTIEMRSPSFPTIESRIQYLKFGISQNSTLRKRKGQEGLREVRQFWKIAKVTRIFPATWKDWATNKAKIARITISQNSTLRKRKGQEGLWDVRKFRKNRKTNKNFSSYVKRLSNKYGKNGKNNKFHKILHLQREKGKESLEIWQNTTNWLE